MIARTSYVTIAQASVYYNGRMDTAAWDAASPTLRDKALIQASESIDNLNYIGEKPDDQVHEFPRKDIDTDVTEEIPQEIEEAVCLQALAFLNGFDAEQETRDILTKESSLKDVKTTTDTTTTLIHLKAGLCSEAFKKVSPYLRDWRSFSISKG